MLFRFAYAAGSAVRHEAGVGARVSLQTDTRRAGAFFSGELAEPLVFREAMSALHDVVLADLKYKPPDRSAFLAWKRQRLAGELAAARARQAQLMAAVFRAGLAGAAGLLVYDPVVSVHPDAVLFEAFSRDESAYAMLSVDRTAFREVGGWSAGTTNIDFSAALAEQFRRLRSTDRAWLDVEAGGVRVQRAGAEAHFEKKIDLPDSWVRGFVQVQSATGLPALRVALKPVDIANVCALLRRTRERRGPRSLRWELRRGQPVQAVLEPWETRLVLDGPPWAGDASGFGGRWSEGTPGAGDGPADAGFGSPVERRDGAVVVRTWGRRRWHLLERLLPWMESAELHLLGRGMPSFVVVRLPRMTFTLGLSGWTANDWTASAGFDLLRPGTEADRMAAEVVEAELAARQKATAEDLARGLGLRPDVARGALDRLCRAGRVIFDLGAGVFRRRTLTAEPLPAEVVDRRDERTAEAETFLRRREVHVARRVPADRGAVSIAGEAGRQAASALLDPDGRLLRGECGCHFHRANRLRRGPCPHLLALMLADRAAG